MIIPVTPLLSTVPLVAYLLYFPVVLVRKERRTSGPNPPILPNNDSPGTRETEKRDEDCFLPIEEIKITKERERERETNTYQYYRQYYSWRENAIRRFAERERVARSYYSWLD